MKTRRGFRVLIMMLIFWFSSRDGGESREQSSYVEKGINRVVREGKVKINIRKKAHFFIYLTLGSTAFLSYSRRGKKEILTTLCFVTLYAMTDEYHQSFIIGRGASIRDVIIDASGGLSGALLVKIVSGRGY
ncbi:MAG: VanZ family protein [Fusobacteriaceae bacterium]